MKLEEIEDLWSKDCKIDRSSLDNESLRIPELHHKYYKIFIREKVSYDKKRGELDSLLKTKWEYYQGKLDQDTLKENKWEQCDLKILRADLDRYIDADQDVIKKRLDIALLNSKVEMLEEIIKVINNRGFQIKNAVDFIKWSQGSS